MLSYHTVQTFYKNMSPLLSCSMMNLLETLSYKVNLGFLWKVFCYPGVFKFLWELTSQTVLSSEATVTWKYQQTMGRLKAEGGWAMPQTNSFPMLVGNILRINSQMLNIAETAKVIHQICLYSQKYQGYDFSNLGTS